VNDPQLKNLLDDLDSTKAAGDGVSRLVVTRLAKKHIPYRVMLGRLELQDKVVYPHFWVEAGGCVIDYRAAQQVDDKSGVPHGVIPLDSVKGRYQGQEIVIDPLPDYLYDQLNR